MYRCLLCKQSWGVDDALCSQCLVEFMSLIYPRIPIESKRVEFPVFSATEYRGATSRWIWHLKSLAPVEQSPYLNQWILEIAKHWAEVINELEADILVPIPSNPWRTLSERSLSDFVAESLSTTTGLPNKKNLLTMPWSQVLTLLYNKSQKDYGLTERLQNTERFRSRAASLRKIRVLLVDDVCTTGATLKEASRALLEAGYHIAGAFVLSHVEDYRRAHDPSVPWTP